MEIVGSILMNPVRSMLFMTKSRIFLRYLLYDTTDHATIKDRKQLQAEGRLATKGAKIDGF